jgi:hypothetical protein
MFTLESAGASAPAPLSIVRPANDPIPPKHRHVFVNDREPAVTQHPPHFIQHQPRVLRVMKHVTEQNRVETLIAHGKMATVER